MYPKLKVRSQDQDFRYGGGSINPSLLGLKALFLEEFRSSSKKESKPTPKKVEAVAPSSKSKGLIDFCVTPKKVEAVAPSSESKDSNDRQGEEDMRPHIRASFIPRPRAVLSSPDNDAIIGSKSKGRIEERTSRLKSHQFGHKCNACTKHSSNGRPKTGREVLEVDTDKSDVHKPHRLGLKCNATRKHSAAERFKSGGVAPEETSNKSDNRENMKTVTTLRVKE